jgi:putative transposase
MKSMAQLEYHYGLKIRIYPSDYQKQIIKVNSDASRFVYNEMVAIGKELWQLTESNCQLIRFRIGSNS